METRIFILIVMFFMIPFTKTLKAQNDSLHKATMLMKKELNLNEKQIVKVDAINKRFELHRKEIMLIQNRRDRFIQLKQMSEAKDKEMKTVLTPEQFTRYLTLKQEYINNVKESYKENNATE